jgi:vitamin B12 transporter
MEVKSNYVDGFWRVRSAYQLTKSVTTSSEVPNDVSIGKQLVYTPVHTASALGTLSFRKWALDAFVQFSGKRYTESSNSGIYALQPFALVDLSVGNLFNKTYMLYSGRAMPGINFNIRLTYQLKNKIT